MPLPYIHKPPNYPETRSQKTAKGWKVGPALVVLKMKTPNLNYFETNQHPLPSSHLSPNSVSAHYSSSLAPLIMFF